MFKRTQLLQLHRLSLRNIHLVDAIESIARKDIVSALEMGVSAHKSVFASIAIINQVLPDLKLMLRTCGKFLTCSTTSRGISEPMIF